jgi:hypothetical protein
MSFLSELKKKRSDWVQSNRENNFEEGILNLLTELYPDNAHFIYELLQNAEDARATKVQFELSETGLLCRHNGQRAFSEDNVESITSIGRSTKSNDVNQIGKFGVGFKAVFSYTESPRVYSGEFNFEILDLVCPNEISSLAGLGTDTVFEFPFNKPGKPKSIAFAEVKKGLNELSETALLFLSNIEQISWSSTDGSHVDITRVAVSNLEYKIEYLRDGGGSRNVAWLRFADQVNGKPQHHVAIAFALETLEKPSPIVGADMLGRRYRVRRCDGQVSIYFPAEKEVSKLRFHIHAPFASTVARDSIRSRPENEPLVEQLALLLKRALKEIREQGLLTTDFLEVLPLLDDDLSTFYAPLMQSILEEMVAEPLTPAYLKGHAPASHLIQGSKALKDLLSVDDLNFLFRSEAAHRVAWAAHAMQGSRAERFLKGLEIRTLTSEKFFQFIKSNAMPTATRHLDIKTRRFVTFYNGQQCESADEFCRLLWRWFDVHDDAWMQRLYATLSDIGRTNYTSSVPSLSGAPIVRISNSSYLAGTSCYFPTDEVDDDPVFPRVRSGVFSSGRSEQERQAARMFLADVGVQTIGPREDVERILKERYSATDSFPSFTLHLNDMSAFIRYWEEYPDDIDVFSSFSIFCTRDEKYFCKASVAYLDTPFVDTGLAGLYVSELNSKALECFGISHRYLDDKKISKVFVDFAIKAGVQQYLPIRKTTTFGHPMQEELQADLMNGAKLRDTGRDEDYDIEQLDTLLTSPEVRKSRAVWLTMRSAVATVLEARFQANRQQTLRKAPSRLVLRLRNYAWLPLKDGTLVTPDKATELTLDKTFPVDNQNGWLTAIGFGESAKKHSDFYRKKEQEVVRDGFASLDEYDDFRATIVNLSVSERKQLLSVFRNQVARPLQEREFPARPVRNTELRECRITAEVQATPEKTLKQVSRQVQVGYQEAKVDSREYLRQQYTNDYQVMLCQVCQDELPFKNLDGEYFFEAVALIENLPKFLGMGFLCLCPNHAAMYRHSNGNKADIVRLIESAVGQEITVTLGGRERTILFTEIHLADIRASLKALNETDSERCT